MPDELTIPAANLEAIASALDQGDYVGDGFDERRLLCLDVEN